MARAEMGETNRKLTSSISNNAPPEVSPLWIAKPMNSTRKTKNTPYNMYTGVA